MYVLLPLVLLHYTVTTIITTTTALQYLERTHTYIVCSRYVCLELVWFLGL